MRELQAPGQKRWRILVPSFAAACLPFLTLWLPPARWNSGLVMVAGGLTLAIAVIVVRAPWGRLPGWSPCIPAFAYLVVVALLRAAGGPSGIAPMVLLPVFWLALCGTRRQLWCLLVGVAVVFFTPLILVGGVAYPSSTWRAGILFVAASGLVGVTVQSLVARVRAQERERDRLLEQLDDLAHTDELTGLANRRAWQSELDRGLARAKRTGEPISVGIVDVDGLKAINDEHGHLAGDRLLMMVARSWPEVLRPDDVLARIGGDEFAVLMPACTEAEAAGVIARLRAHTPSPHGCSVGLATWDRSEPADALVARADEALYHAKRQSRNRAAPGRSLAGLGEDLRCDRERRIGSWDARVHAGV
jgi:diguanylate cyclase (GGDEF)-like protein